MTPTRARHSWPNDTTDQIGLPRASRRRVERADPTIAGPRRRDARVMAMTPARARQSWPNDTTYQIGLPGASRRKIDRFSLDPKKAVGLLGLLVLASVVVLSSALATRHQMRAWGSKHHRIAASLQSSSSSFLTSPESNFWVAKADNNNTSTTSNALPAIRGLDKETGPLPPGAYRIIDGEVPAPCYLSVSIQPPPSENVDGDAWSKGVANCQKMIDSGFNAFLINNDHAKGGSNRNKKMVAKRRPPSAISLESLQKRHLQTESRHEAERVFYRVLRKNTPASVLRLCNFMVNLEIPEVMAKTDKDSPPLVYGNGQIVRASVCDALSRTRGESLDVVLECEF